MPVAETSGNDAIGLSPLAYCSGDDAVAMVRMSRLLRGQSPGSGLPRDLPPAPAPCAFDSGPDGVRKLVNRRVERFYALAIVRRAFVLG